MSTASNQYEVVYSVHFVDALGDGKDGQVLQTAHGQAVKFFLHPEVYRREVRAYKLLKARGIDEVNGFHVPELIRHDDSLLAIEMTIVRPPFILDFASAYTVQENARLGFDDDVLQEREAHWKEIFAERWPLVEATCVAFTQATGLILLDLSLNNIKFDCGK
ncbi:hypothetical protein BH09PLA1_BH09PLA1_07800 [soil metagenome]